MRNASKWFMIVAAAAAAMNLHGSDGSAGYPLSRMTVAYGAGHPAAPPIEMLESVEVSLVRSGQVLSAEGPGDAVTVRVGDALPAGTRVTEAGLQKVLAALVARLNAEGIYGVVAFPSRDQIDPGTKEDMRPAGEGSLKVVVWLMEVAQMRSIAKGGRIRAEDSIMNPRHARILGHSPLKPRQDGQEGSLFRKPDLDDYLRRLNRHPGRIVEAAISSTDQPGRVVLDYLVNEERPWFVYGQFSNTGTEFTDEFRQRVGFVHNQLTNHDDVLSVDFITAALDTANAVFASYEFPVVYPDILRTRVYGSWGDYDATAVLTGLAGAEPTTERFTGSSWVAGAEVIWSPVTFLGASIDLTAGVSTPYFEVTDVNTDTTGKATLLTPYFSVRAERMTELVSFSASLGYEGNFKEIKKTDLERLGRLGTNDQYDMIRAEIIASGYLEPLFRGLSKRELWVNKPLAHELSFQFRTQQVLRDDRVIPQKEQSIGGFFTVRGYPESAAVGDSSMVGNLEYRFHLPRMLQPASEIERERTAVVEEPPPTLFGRPFNYRPPRVAARPDWDLIIRGFFDYGRTEVNQGTLLRPPQNERDHTIMSVGIGVETQILRNLNARVDWGYALKDLRLGVNIPSPEGESYAPDPSDWDKGQSRLHFLLTFVW